VNSYKVVIEDIYNLKFVFPDGEIQGNIMCLPGFLLEKSISGVDFSNRKSIVDFLRVINYFNDDRKYNRVMVFKGDDLALLKYISILKLKFIALTDETSQYLSGFYSMRYLDRVKRLSQIDNLDKFLTDSLYFFKRVLKFDAHTYYKDVLLAIRSRINKDFLKGFSFFGDKYDIFLFQGILKD
jgi:hypothetical protein